jgi:hypothetical protein
LFVPRRDVGSDIARRTLARHQDQVNRWHRIHVICTVWLLMVLKLTSACEAESMVSSRGIAAVRLWRRACSSHRGWGT